MGLQARRDLELFLKALLRTLETFLPLETIRAMLTLFQATVIYMFGADLRG